MDDAEILAKCAKIEDHLNKANLLLKLLPAEDDDVGEARLGVLKAEFRVGRVRKRYAKRRSAKQVQAQKAT
jgi:hypothetical protein